MKETEIQKACLEWLQWQGYLAWRNNTAGIYDQKKGVYRFHGMKGVSDILCCLPPDGKLLAVEVKAPRGKPTEYQKEFLDKVNDAGGIGIVVTSVDDLEKALS